MQAGGLEVCVEAMQRLPDDAGTQQQACGAIWSLSLLQEHKGRSATAGSIEAVILALNRHPGHAGVQHEVRRDPLLLSVPPLSMCIVRTIERGGRLCESITGAVTGR